MPQTNPQPEIAKRIKPAEAVRRIETVAPAPRAERQKQPESRPPAESEAASKAETRRTAARPRVAATNLAAAPVKDAELIAVEKILEQDVGELYKQLPPERRAAFKREGEHVAQVIWLMVETAKIQVNKIIHLILNWLKMIPGINRYFLEQETKIKTDRIIALAKNKTNR